MGNVDTLVSTLTRRGHNQCDCLVTLSREKQCCFSENPTWEQRGSKRGRMHDWWGSQSLQPLRHVPFSRTEKSAIPCVYIIIQHYLFIIGTMVEKLHSRSLEFCCCFSTKHILLRFKRFPVALFTTIPFNPISNGHDYSRFLLAN